MTIKAQVPIIFQAYPNKREQWQS